MQGAGDNEQMTWSRAGKHGAVSIAIVTRY